MEKLDLKKQLKHLYQPPSDRVVLVDVPVMTFLMIDGEGDPNISPAFQEAVEVLFSLSYTLKFMVKKSPQAIDYGVMPLEGLWWVDDMTQFNTTDKSNWQWTLMIMQPAFIHQEMIDTALVDVQKKKNLAGLTKVRFQSFPEGKSAQIMHIGPFSDEGPTVEILHKHIKENGFTLIGKHHEIYLSDIRRADPAKWKTVIRQPIF